MRFRDKETRRIGGLLCACRGIGEARILRSRRNPLHPQDGRVSGRLGSAYHVGRNHDQQGGVILLGDVAGQVVQAWNIAESRRSADGAALLLVQVAQYHHSFAFFQRDHTGISPIVEHWDSVERPASESVDL